MAALVDQYTPEELEEIVKSSLNMKEVVGKIGYSTTSGKNSSTVKNRIEKYNIDISHFTSVKGVYRTPENIFVENSTAGQTVLRRYYIKGEYTPYICSICEQGPEWQGKPLTLILDHINGNNHDDRLENLRWVCPNCNQQLETTGFKKMRVKNIEKIKTEINKNEKRVLKKTNTCIDCGAPITNTSKRCKECLYKHQSIPLEEMPITRNELKSLIRTTPFTTIAKQYNVTDNAIRKWCDKFNLPRKKIDINNYTEEEWEVL